MNRILIAFVWLSIAGSLYAVARSYGKPLPPVTQEQYCTWNPERCADLNNDCISDERP